MKFTSNFNMISEILGREVTQRENDFLSETCRYIIEYKDPFNPPSSGVIPLSISCGKNYFEVMADSISMFGRNHFVFSKVCKFLDNQGAFEIKGRIPGIGHPELDEDYRVSYIIKIGRKYYPNNVEIELMSEYADILKKRLNLAGAIVPYLREIGFTENNIDFFPLLCRLIGLTKQYEKLSNSGQIKLGKSKDLIEKAEKIYATGIRSV